MMCHKVIAKFIYWHSFQIIFDKTVLTAQQFNWNSFKKTHIFIILLFYFIEMKYDRQI